MGLTHYLTESWVIGHRENPANISYPLPTRRFELERPARAFSRLVREAREAPAVR